MLPVVAVVALLLLGIAAWRFFFAGPNASMTPHTPLTQELSAGRSARLEPNQAEAGQTRNAFSSGTVERPSVPLVSVPVPPRRVLEMDPLAVPVPVRSERSVSYSSTARQTTPTRPTVVQTPSRPVKEQPIPQRVIPRQAASTPAASREPAKVTVPQTQVKLSGWMVQVGAFSNKAAAEAVSQRFTKAGYTAAVTSTQTLHRVLVQAGSTREAAESLAARLGQSGYQGAFIVPPRQ
jgi:cell division protein FtsN